jgi:hydroxymethylpyrimidine pyrophosphatase-like HAD family hydrolase
VLVTGREIESLADTFPHLDAFDRVVAENGALLYDPATGREEPLAPPPPPELLSALDSAAVPRSVGRSIVATMEPFDLIVRAIISALELPWHITYNKGAVMALPADVSKATGLLAALPSMGLGPAQVVAVGDAEDDLPLLQICGVGVAVQNALPAVKALADLVTAGAYGAGVAEVVDDLIAGRLSLRTNNGAS